ncbi:MAG: carotenoid biosynthesis protein [Spirochaetia bacterium]
MTMLQTLPAELAQLSTVSMVVGAAWVLVMICVPIFRWVLGEGAERVGISLGVLFQAATVAVLLFEGLPPWHAAAAVIGIPLFGWAVEFVGSRTGFPFGGYQYTDVLQPQIRHVPVVIPLAWLMMIPPAWAIGGLLAGPHGTTVAVLLSGLAFMAWDLFLDPQMVSWDFWRWRDRGVYVGIPLSNFVGWFGAGTVVSLIFYTPDIPVAPLLLVYIITWILETIGQLAFWKMIVSGIIGFFAMGALIFAALL